MMMFAVGNLKIDDATSATMLLEEKRAIAPTVSRYRHRHTASECSQSFLRIRGSHAIYIPLACGTEYPMLDQIRHGPALKPGSPEHAIEDHDAD
jgi:hypothetical protein